MVTERYSKVSPEVPVVITDGRKVVSTAGAREALVAVATPAKGVYITALSTNTGVVVVGGVTVVATASIMQGTPLWGGDTIPVEIDDLMKIYLDVTVSGNGVSYTKLV
jgi:hypothetical protein